MKESQFQPKFSGIKVIVFAMILIDRGKVFLAVTIAHHSYLFGNLVTNAQ
jgi:hypothetical protein